MADMAPSMKLEPEPELEPGTRVGHYEIVGELGRGGLGVVYRARDTTLGRDVALKSPLPEHASEEARRRFLTEARAASCLSHPGIVPIFEAFEEGSRPWLAMALAEGRPLRAVLAERAPLPAEEVVRHGEALAEALDAAHVKRVLHRDVTPNNIFVTADGRMVLMDFGLARFFIPRGEESRVSTQDGSDMPGREVAGTLGYMSPEQLLARPLDPTTDIFALGAVLYEMCTGTHAFPGASSGEVLDATLHHDPPPISRFAHAVPPELERIIRKAIAKRPDERYATARDLLVDLRALRRQLEGGRPAAGPVRRWGRWTTRATAVGIAALGVMAVVAWTLWPQPGLPAGVPRQLTAGAAWEAEPAIAPDGSLVAYAAEEAGNVDIWLVDAHGGDPLQLTHDPAVDGTPAWFPDGSAVAYASNLGDRPAILKVPRLGGSPVLLVADATHPTISPDGTRIAFARVGPRSELRIFVAPLADPGAARMITTDGEGVWDHVQPAWSPDGTRICYSAQRDLWVVPGTGGGAQRLTTDGEYDREPAWSPDGRFVYFTSYREGTVALWRVPAHGGEVVRVTMGTGPENHPTLSRDGTRLAYSTLLDTADVVVRDLATGSERLVGDLRDEESPVLSPDRQAVAFVSDRRNGRPDLWLQPLSPDGEPAGTARQLTDHPGTVAQPSFSPDGRWVAYHRVLEGQRDIWIVPVSGGPPGRFTDHPAIDIHPDWSPDGRYLAWVSDRGGGQQVWVAPVANGRPAGPPRQVTDGPNSCQAPAWSRDGARIAFIGSDAHGARDVWTVSASGGAARRVTSGAGADRVSWDWRTPGTLLVSGVWGESRFSIRRVTEGGGPDNLPQVLVWLGTSALRTDFDVSRDGRLLAFGRQDPRGDIWILEARSGRY